MDLKGQKLNIFFGNHYLIGLDKSAVDKLVLMYQISGIGLQHLHLTRPAFVPSFFYKRIVSCGPMPHRIALTLLE